MRVLEYWRENWSRQNGWLLPLELVLAMVLAGVLVTGGIYVRNISKRPLQVSVYLGIPRAEVEQLMLPGVRVNGPSDRVQLKADGSTEKYTQEPASVFAELNVFLDNPTSEQLTWVLQKDVPGLALMITVLTVLLWVVHTARREPFSSANIIRLRILGVFVIVGGYLCSYWKFLAGVYLSSSVTSGEWGGYYMQFDWIAFLLAGLVLFGVSQMIRRGSEIRMELEEVI